MTSQGSKSSKEENKLLELTFADGSTKTFPFSPDSQLSVNTPDGANGIKSGSWGEITGLELVPDPDSSEPVADPAPVEAAPAAPFAGPDAVVGGTLEIDPDAAPIVVPPDPTPVDTDATPELPADPDGTVQDTPPDPVFDTAVTSANDAIVSVGLGTSDPDALAKALADVTAALETYPDSAELQDAKTQLTELSAPAEAA